MLQQQLDYFLNCSQTGKTDIDGVEWNYFIAGNNTQSTILILTGGGSIAEAAFIYANSLATEHRVITLNIPAVHTVDACMQAIKTILNQLSVDKVSILGFSMGGMLAQCFVREFPQRVDKLIMFVSMLPSKEYAKKYAKYKFAISLVPEFLFKIISKRSLRKLVLADSAKADKAVIDFWLKFFDWEFDSGKMNKQLLLATSDILIDYFQNYQFTAADLKEWPGKILLFESSRDEVISSTERMRFKDVHPQAQVIAQLDSGHFGEGLLNPSKAISAISEFLAK
jgi:pimeloyl-ACP methyl ester carboxylesterase